MIHKILNKIKEIKSIKHKFSNRYNVALEDLYFYRYQILEELDNNLFILNNLLIKYLEYKIYPIEYFFNKNFDFLENNYFFKYTEKRYIEKYSMNMDINQNIILAKLINETLKLKLPKEKIELLAENLYFPKYDNYKLIINKFIEVAYFIGSFNNNLKMYNISLTQDMDYMIYMNKFKENYFIEEKKITKFPKFLETIKKIMNGNKFSTGEKERVFRLYLIFKHSDNNKIYIFFREEFKSIIEKLFKEYKNPIDNKLKIILI